MVSAGSEAVQLRDVPAQSVGEPVEDKGKQEQHGDGKPDVMLVRLQVLREVYIIRKGRADNIPIFRIIGGTVEIVLTKGSAVAFYRRAHAAAHSLRDLGPAKVVAHGTVVLPDIVEDHPSFVINDGNADTTNDVIFQESRHQRRLAGILTAILQGIMSLVVEILKPQFQGVNLILFLAVLLEEYERHGEDEEQGQHREIQPCTDGKFLIVHLCVKIISEAKACRQIVGIRTKLFADTCDVHVHRPVGDQHVGRPYIPY